MRLANLRMHRTGIDRAVMILGNAVISAVRGAALGAVGMVIVSAVVRLLTLRHKMHPAFRAVSRMVLPHLRVHRADVGCCLGIVRDWVCMVAHSEVLLDKDGEGNS